MPQEVPATEPEKDPVASVTEKGQLPDNSPLQRQSSISPKLSRRASGIGPARSSLKMLRSSTSLVSDDGEDPLVIPVNPSNPKVHNLILG